MSVTTTVYARAGFNALLTAPLSGVYYPEVAIYNALTQIFAVQNGIGQDNLASQLAVLYQVPSSGQSMVLQPSPRFYPYGAYLGPIQAVWYQPDDSPGTFPTTLGALAGLIQWTPAGISLDDVNSVYLVPGTSISSIVVSNASDTSETITIKGVQSGLVLGTGSLGGATSVQIALGEATGDTVFAVTSSAPITATLSLVVGTPPTVNGGGGGGGGGGGVAYPSLLGQGQLSSPGDLTQTGGFTVYDTEGDGITLESLEPAGNINLFTSQLLQGGGTVGFSSGGFSVNDSVQVELEAPSIVLSAALTGQISIAAGDTLTLSGVVKIQGNTGDTVIRVGVNLLGFFDTAPVVQQVSGGTLAGVIDGLVALGLFSS